MKFNHEVKLNGIYYPPGTEVPYEDNKKTATPTVETMVGETVSEVVEEPKNNSTYTIEDVEKLNYPQMKKFAKELGLKTNPKTSGEELKAMIIKKLNL